MFLWAFNPGGQIFSLNSPKQKTLERFLFLTAKAIG
jgi:hypothetical protein